MLGFKFIDTLEGQGLTGPVPLFGVFGGHEHVSKVETTDIFNRSTFISILSQTNPDGSEYGPSTNIILKDYTTLSQDRCVNLLPDTEGLLPDSGYSNGWQYGNISAGNTVEVTDGIGDDLSQGIIYSAPAKKLTKENGTTPNNNQLHCNFPNEVNKYYTFSIFISYGELTNAPSIGQPKTTLKIDDATQFNVDSPATLTIKWNSDGTIDTTGLSGSGKVSSGYDTIKVGDRVWYHIYLTNHMKTANGQGKIHIWPAGWTDLDADDDGIDDQIPATGHIYVCHPQVEEGKYYTEYVPQYTKDGYDKMMMPSLLAGPKSQNMVAPIANDQTIFDIKSNTALDNITIANNKAFISAEDYYSKYLVYRDSDFTGRKLRLLKAYPRFPVAWKENKLVINELVTPSVAVRQNINDYNIITVPMRDNKHSWNIHIKKTRELIDNRITNLSGGSSRQSKIWNEKPTHLSSKLIEVSEKGLAAWKYSETWLVNNTSYYLKTVQDCSIILNYDLTVSDIDRERGLVLFEENIPEDLLVSYSLDDTWCTIPVELNPMFSNNIPEEIAIKINDRGHIVYELDGNGTLINDGSIYTEDISVYETYTTIGIVSMKWGKPEIIDIRRDGGMLINKDSNNYDLSDHTVFGFMGVDPTQLNVAILRIPDKALETLIYQFEESHFQYSEEDAFTYPLDWTSNRTKYIDFIKAPIEEEGQQNIARDELFTYCKRHMPAGVRIAITDKHDNLIGLN
tara:strand:+ start:2518 stop:4725 length:2208 start_codon:yes stop_codon:yes gene_type:complete